MKLQDVLNALEVAKCGSISKASQVLFLSQPALSLQLQRLEQELGYALFVRSPSGMRLTPEGTIFCQQGQVLCDQWDSFQMAVRSHGGHRSRLRIGVGARVYANDLFQKITDFFDGYPEIEVSFSTEAGQDFFSAMEEGTLDLALDRLPKGDLLPDLQGYHTTELIRERQCVLMAPDALYDSQIDLPYEALNNWVFLTGLKDSLEEKTLHQDCQAFCVTPKRVFHSDSMSTIMHMIRSGKGCAIGPASFGPYYQVKAVPLLPERYFALEFICPHKNMNRPEIRMLHRYLLDVCQGLS